MNKKLLIAWTCIGMIVVCMAHPGYTKPILPPEEALPPSIMPVIILKGSYYEMGYQYGQQGAEAIAARKNLWWARGIKEFKTRDAVVREIRAYESQVKKFAPEIIDVMKGIADGATATGVNLSYMDVLILNIAKALRPREGAAYPPDAGCGHIHAWGTTTKDGKLICVDNRDEEFTPQVALVYLPDKGNAFITATDAGQVACHPVMNNKGVFIGGSSGSARKEDMAKYGVPRPIALAHLAFSCNNAIEAKDWLVANSTNWSGGINYSLSDVKGNAFALETTPVSAFVRKPGDFGEVNFIFATNNAWIKEARKAGDTYGPVSEPRNEQIFALLRNYQGKIDVEFLKMMYRMPGYPGVGNLSNNRVVIGLPSEGDKGLVYICTGIPDKTLPIDLKGFGLALPVNPTYTYFQLSLNPDPDKITIAAKNTAENYLYRALLEMAKLNFSSPGYGPLNEVFSQAKSEWYRGVYAHENARAAKDREAIYYFSRALTAFTRCQALVQQVYEELVPKARPTTPEDLGCERPKTFIRFGRPPHETSW